MDAVEGDDPSPIALRALAALADPGPIAFLVLAAVDGPDQIVRAHSLLSPPW